MTRLFLPSPTVIPQIGSGGRPSGTGVEVPLSQAARNSSLRKADTSSPAPDRPGPQQVPISRQGPQSAVSDGEMFPGHHTASYSRPSWTTVEPSE